MMRIAALICGILAILLGGLWLLQGLGVVHIIPILCIADCVPIQGPSVGWAVIGAVTMGIGGLIIFWSRKHFQKQQ